MITAEQQHAQRNRGTIFVEESTLLSVTEFPGDQFIMRLRAPRCAAAAQPGSFVHVSCEAALPMRRPLSIMRANGDWIEILYKIVGDGLRGLSNTSVGETVSLLGPIGQPFKPSAERPNTLLIGGGVGIPPIVFLADHLRQESGGWRPIAILGSEIPFPFERRTSSIEAHWLDRKINQTMPLLEEWGIPCRLATFAGYDGCFHGYVTDLADQWLGSLPQNELEKTAVYSCGPTPMLKAVATLAKKYDLPCQVSLEEFMACAVGGCAGCVVAVKTAGGTAMKRVCVDGPVFDASSVF